MICEGLSHCASTIWELQEMRFAAIFDDVSLVAITIIMAAVSCFIAIRSQAMKVFSLLFCFLSESQLKHCTCCMQSICSLYIYIYKPSLVISKRALNWQLWFHGRGNQHCLSSLLTHPQLDIYGLAFFFVWSIDLDLLYEAMIYGYGDEFKYQIHI